MYLVAQEQREEYDKTRAKKISGGIHLALLLLLLLPIMRPDKDPDEFQRAITITFEEPPEPPKVFSNESSSKMSGSSAAAAQETATPREKVEVTKIEQKPVQQQTAFKVPERKEIITAPTPEIPVPVVHETKSEVIKEPIEETEIVEEVPDALSVPDPEPVVVPVVEAVEVAEEEEEKPVVDPSWADGLASSGKGTSKATTGSKGDSDSDKAGNSKGNGDTAGEGKGDGNAGKDTGVGNKGSGNFWGNAPGDGMLTRDIKYRANAARLAIEKGTAVFSICVNRKGDVIWVEYDYEKSTISNEKDMVLPLKKLMMEYKFEQDFTAPQQQCGKWTIKVDIDK